jgi:ADP-heptose:LPS heptosyltransferase
MHLAAALGAPTIGLFGLTDPSRTGPLGPRVTVLQKSDVRSRAIDRESPAAREALDRITVNDVFTASLAMR